MPQGQSAEKPIISYRGQPRVGRAARAESSASGATIPPERVRRARRFAVPPTSAGMWLISRHVPLPIYPGRIPKFNRDLKRAVPKTHLINQSPNNS